jgi:amidase
MTSTSGLAGRPAHVLSGAIARREISCVEVVTAHLDRIDEMEPTHHALVSRRPRADVLAEAKERDAELSRGERRGWLHGLPHAVKDLSDVEGLPTTSGFFALDQAPVATADSLFVERLRAAGTVFVGKTNTPEFGLGSHTYNQIAPTTRNALDPSRTAGGSSGGASVAVALGMLPVADGSDFMGSLRNPPGWNGVLGLRPTFGRIPDFEGDLFTVGGGVAGPIARNVTDLALLLATMSGPSRRVPLSISEDPATLLDQLQDTPHRLRIGWLADLAGYLPMEAGILSTCEQRLRDFAGIGAVVEQVVLPSTPGFESLEQLWPTWVTYRQSQVGAGLSQLLDDPVLGPRLKPEAVWEINGFRALTPSDVAAMVRGRHGLYESCRHLFADFDMLALPTAQVFPFDADLTWPKEITGTPMTTYHRWMEVTAPATLAGLPALALPAGLGPSGLPIGLQLIGPPRSEGLLLRAARALEKLTTG